MAWPIALEYQSIFVSVYKTTLSSILLLLFLSKFTFVWDSPRAWETVVSVMKYAYLIPNMAPRPCPSRRTHTAPSTCPASPACSTTSIHARGIASPGLLPLHPSAPPPPCPPSLPASEPSPSSGRSPRPCFFHPATPHKHTHLNSAISTITLTCISPHALFRGRFSWIACLHWVKWTVLLRICILSITFTACKYLIYADIFSSNNDSPISHTPGYI